MFKLDPIRRGMPTYASTPYNRGVALALWIVNIPALMIGVILTVVGWLFPLLLFVPGVVLFAGYYKIYQDKLEIRKVIQIWRWTIIYNMFLAILTVGFCINHPELLWPALLFQGWSVFMAASAYKELKKKHGSHYFEENIEDWGYEIEYIEKEEEEPNPRERETLSYQFGITYMR